MVIDVEGSSDGGAMNSPAKILIALSLAVLFCICFTACEDDTVSTGTQSIGLYGQIVNAQGDPLSLVEIHYIFYTNRNDVVQSVGLQHSVPTPEVVTLTVLDPFDKPVKTLVDEELLQVGSYVFIFDSAVTNGVYSFLLEGDSLQKTPFYFRTDNVDTLVQRPPLLTSGTSGEFYLSPTTLGIGRTIGNDVIHDSISIVLTAPGFEVLVSTFRLDTTVSTEKTFMMMEM